MIKDVQPVSALKARMPQVLKELHEHRRPILVVSSGHPQAVLQDVESYQQTQDAIALLKIMLLSETSISAGRGSSTKDVADRLRTRIRQRE